MEEATAFAQSVTNGQGADSAIVTVGVTKGEHIAQAFTAIRKAGTVVVTGLGDITEVGIPISPGELTLFQKRVQGSLFGASSPSQDILAMLDLYQAGKLQLDELVTNTYTLDDDQRRLRRHARRQEPPRRPDSFLMRPPKRLEAPACRRGRSSSERRGPACRDAASRRGQARTSSRRPRPMMKRQPTP